MRIAFKMDRKGSRVAEAKRKSGDGFEGSTAALGAYLASRGLKHSRQRERIAEIFFGLEGHVSVEELLAHARREDSRVSPATVYRTMKLLAEGGLATAREFGDGQTRYEVATGRSHHDHLVCVRCGAIEEFEEPDIEALQGAVAARHGFEVSHHRLELYGRCRRCRGAAPGEGRS